MKVVFQTGHRKAICQLGLLGSRNWARRATCVPLVLALMEELGVELATSKPRNRRLLDTY